MDPESAYAMNGLAWAAGYPVMKNDHPGTTTILLVGIMIKLWTFLASRSDVIELGLKNYDAIIYAARAAEAVIIRCIAGFRRHRQECDTQLACGDAVSSLAFLSA